MSDDTNAPHPPPAHIQDDTLPHDVARTDIFFAAVKTTRMPMIVTDPNQPDNPIVFCNDAFSFMTGYAEAEILGSNCRFLQGPETDQEVIDQLRAAIRDREEIAVEVLNYRKNGSTFWNALFVSPVYGEDGKLLYFFGSQLDISRRREAEEALHEAQKMEAVGQLTGGIAHDFNNLLQVILGYVDILEARADSGDRAVMRAIEAIGGAAKRGATLTQQLLAFARRQELRDRLLNLNQLLFDFRPILARTTGELTVRQQFDDNLWNVRIDPTQAEMALLNIMSNARDALGQGGTITITTQNVHLPDGHEQAARKLGSGDYAMISITDDGPGFDPAIIDKVFDPFFTTKEMGKGTGLGLAMVYGFARQSGGVAIADNPPGDGARISIFFPRAGGAPDRRPAAKRQRVANSGAERVLMVEDQADVAELGQAMLSDLGYDVTHAPDARTALDMLSHDADFRLLFTDILMPGGMNGVALANEVKRRHPRIGILLTTGFADEAIDEGARSYELIRKPYRRGELDDRIRAVLDKPGART